MINKDVNDKNYVSWAMMMYELSDAHEHLGELIQEMNREDSFDETDFRVQLGHVYAHLNRAWNGRNDTDAVNTEQREARSQMPVDLVPVG
jgi:hypothetical protein